MKIRIYNNKLKDQDINWSYILTLMLERPWRGFGVPNLSKFDEYTIEYNYLVISFGVSGDN